MNKFNVSCSFIYIATITILTGCASTYDYQPPVGHPAHPESDTVLLSKPASPYLMEYPYSVTPEEIDEHDGMKMQNQDMNSMEGGSSE